MPPVRTLGQLSDFERGRILEISRRIGRCCQAWTPEGREHRARGTGRRRTTTIGSRSIKGCLPVFVT
jgi:hypothetical protein